jgi:hypothetical protein
MPDSSTRLVSLHDPDARPIAKGRIGKSVEFGYKAQVVDNEDGIVLDYDLREGNAADAGNRPQPSNASPAASAPHREPLPPTAATAKPASRTSFINSASKPLPYLVKHTPAPHAARTNTDQPSAN